MTISSIGIGSKPTSNGPDVSDNVQKNICIYRLFVYNINVEKHLGQGSQWTISM